MLQVRPHMNDSKLTVRYIPPSSTKVPTAESPSTSKRSAFAQMRSYGPTCACLYVSGVSNRCVGPAGSFSESQKAASGWAKVRAIRSSAARSVNVLDTPGACAFDLDLVTAGVTRYRCCCSGPGENDGTTRWSCCPLRNVAATVPVSDLPREWFHRRPFCCRYVPVHRRRRRSRSFGRHRRFQLLLQKLTLLLCLLRPCLDPGSH